MSSKHRGLFRAEKKAIRRMYESGDLTSLLILYEDHGGSPYYIAFCHELGLDIVEEYNKTCNDLNLNIDYGYEEEDKLMEEKSEEITHTKYMEELVAKDIAKNCKTRDVLEIGGWYVPEEGQDEWSLPNLSWLYDLAPIEDKVMEVESDTSISLEPSTSSEIQLRKSSSQGSYIGETSAEDVSINEPFTMQVAGNFFSKVSNMNTNMELVELEPGVEKKRKFEPDEQLREFKKVCYNKKERRYARRVLGISERIAGIEIEHSNYLNLTSRERTQRTRQRAKAIKTVSTIVRERRHTLVGSPSFSYTYWLIAYFIFSCLYCISCRIFEIVKRFQ